MAQDSRIEGCGRPVGHRRGSTQGWFGRVRRRRRRSPQPDRARIQEIWVDGFAEWAPQELDLLAALLPYCARATITFCLDQEPAGKISWLSSWSVVQRAYEETRRLFAALPNVQVTTELLLRSSNQGRFRDHPVLRDLEECWAEPGFIPAPGTPRIQARRRNCAGRFESWRASIPRPK